MLESNTLIVFMTLNEEEMPGEKNSKMVNECKSQPTYFRPQLMR